MEVNIYLYIIYFQNFYTYCCDQKAWVASVQSFTQSVAASNNRDVPHSLYYCLFAPHEYGCCSLCSSCSWWIAHSTQRQLRGFNNVSVKITFKNHYVLNVKYSTVYWLWDVNGVYLYSSTNLQVLLKIQWIFFVLLSLSVVRNFKGTCSSVNAEGVHG